MDFQNHPDIQAFKAALGCAESQERGKGWQHRPWLPPAFAVRLVTRMRERGLSVDTLAKLTGISRTLLQKLRIPMRHRASGDTVARLAIALDVTERWLVEGEA